jgi:nicotinate-nucleotide--dimethylbenzimidazole phosphoribosyltransferase
MQGDKKMKLEEAIVGILPLCEKSMLESKEQWDAIVKPLNSLGEFEKIITRIAGMQKNRNVSLKKRCLVVMCGDNGVVEEGVSQVDSSVTSIVAKNLTNGTTTVCTMAKYINVDVIPVDIGIKEELNITGLLNKKIMNGTKNMSKEPSMTRKETILAIEVGINLALDLKKQGYEIIATGEMGIGNTTSSSALASVLLNKKVEEVTGIGAGLNGAGLNRKINAIKKAIEINKPDSKDVIDVLSKVGGLDIAGLVGIFLGGAKAGLPILLDGFISGVAALIAYRISPMTKEYMIASHKSNEPAGKYVLDELGLKPTVVAGMCLGEGTGAMVALGGIDMNLEVYKKSIGFLESGIEEYAKLS